MKKTLRSALALLLAALMLCALAATALAEEPEYTYPDEQTFEEDETLETYYTVQVVAGPYQRGAEQTRLEMLEAGFDAFVYKTDAGYRDVFRRADDAMYENKKRYYIGRRDRRKKQ